MSIEMTRAVWRLSGLSPRQKLVMLALADDCRTGRMVASPGMDGGDGLRAKTGMGSTAVGKVLRALVASGLLERVQGSGHKGRNTEWLLLISPIKASPRVTAMPAAEASPGVKPNREPKASPSLPKGVTSEAQRLPPVRLPPLSTSPRRAAPSADYGDTTTATTNACPGDDGLAATRSIGLDDGECCGFRNGRARMSNGELKCPLHRRKEQQQRARAQ